MTPNLHLFQMHCRVERDVRAKSFLTACGTGVTSLLGAQERSRLEGAACLAD